MQSQKLFTKIKNSQQIIELDKIKEFSIFFDIPTSFQAISPPKIREHLIEKIMKNNEMQHHNHQFSNPYIIIYII